MFIAEYIVVKEGLYFAINNILDVGAVETDANFSVVLERYLSSRNFYYLDIVSMFGMLNHTSFSFIPRFGNTSS